MLPYSIPFLHSWQLHHRQFAAVALQAIHDFRIISIGFYVLAAAVARSSSLFRVLNIKEAKIKDAAKGINS